MKQHDVKTSRQIRQWNVYRKRLNNDVNYAFYFR